MLCAALATAGAHKALALGAEQAVLHTTSAEVMVRIASQRRFHLGSVLPSLTGDGGTHVWLGHPAPALPLPASTPRISTCHRGCQTRHHDVSGKASRTGQSLQRSVSTLNTDKCEQKETGNQLNLKHNELDALGIPKGDA